MPGMNKSSRTISLILTSLARLETDESSTALDALGLPSPRELCFRYEMLELCTAVKPWYLRTLFARGPGGAEIREHTHRAMAPVWEAAALAP